MADRLLPTGFEDLEGFVADWALASRNERYAMRTSKTYEELGHFYDAIAARAEEAMIHLDARDLYDLSEEDTRLLHLLYSMIMVADAVNIFHQSTIPDSGSAFYRQVVEPAV